MRPKTNYFLKELVDIVKQELLAIVAVAGVLVFLFNQALASSNQTTATTSQEEPAVTIASTTDESASATDNQTGNQLFDGSDTVAFGRDVQGKNNTLEAWTNTEVIANIGGNSIIATLPTQVTLSGINNGTFRLYITGTGSITLNGTKYNLGKDKTMASGMVAINKNTLIVKFDTAESRIWTISTRADFSNTDPNRTPTILSMIPQQKVLRIGALLSPVAFVQDQAGTIMPTPLIEWSSSNTAVATVDSNGKVTALQAGVATITATILDTDISASLSVNVPNLLQEAPPVIKINVTPADNNENSTINKLISEITKEAKNASSGTKSTATPSVTSLWDKLFGSRQTSAADETLGTDSYPMAMIKSFLSSAPAKDTTNITDKNKTNLTTVKNSTPPIIEGKLIIVYQKIVDFFARIFSASANRL